MSFARATLLSLVLAMGAPQALAQDLDIPLPSTGTPKKAKAGKRRGAKKTPAAKQVPAESVDSTDLDVPMPTAPGKKPQPVEETDLDVPLPTPKPPTAKKPESEGLDEALIPSVGKSSLVLKLGNSGKGARLFVDNKDVGVLPLPAPLPLEPGEHSLVIRKPGFADFSRRIIAHKSRPTEVTVALEAVGGVLMVTSETPGANVFINGQPRGQVPLTGVVLKPGTYEIVVSKEGYESDKQSIVVKAGKEHPVVANLKPIQVAVAAQDRPEQPKLTPPPPTVTPPQPDPLAQTVPEVEPSQPWFKRWYVWAGVGVVAAAATGAVVATQGGKPLSPEKVCGGPCDGTINGFRPAGAR